MSKNYEFNTGSNNRIEVFTQAARILFDGGFKLIDADGTRPWGFFLSVDESQADKFIKEFYDDNAPSGIDTSLPLRPKFLGIEPGKRLSWQYHHRRSEVWLCLAGTFDLVRSETDKETEVKTIKVGDVVSMAQGIRHRGVGLKQWALVAEIWQHTDPDNPSNEDDIVRLADDFGR